MRFDPDTKFWVVTNPGPESEMADICFATSLRGLERQFKGGLTMAENPPLFTDKREAEIEGYGRLLAARAAGAIMRREPGSRAREVTRIELLDGDGKLLFEADLEPGGEQKP